MSCNLPPTAAVTYLLKVRQLVQVNGDLPNLQSKEESDPIFEYLYFLFFNVLYIFLNFIFF
jgi:hypothetical protein